LRASRGGVCLERALQRSPNRILAAIVVARQLGHSLAGQANVQLADRASDCDTRLPGRNVRWSVGGKSAVRLDVEPVWVPTVFTKNRERLLEAEVAHKFSWPSF
jgi:hypothetical protein